MRIFVAGATGAIGKRLIPMLVGAGHLVTGTTRHADKTASLLEWGATPAIVNVLDARDVLQAVQQAEPEVIIHQATAIPAHLNIRHLGREFAATNRLRIEGSDNLMAAGRAVGCRRFVAQSYLGWPYARTGNWIKTEEDPLISDAETEMRETLRAIVHVESTFLVARDIEGFVLRYGSFYGPGTSLAPGGSTLEDIRKRKVPIVGAGTGYWSFLHIDDAAGATLAALEANTPGLYNIADDEPAPVAQWLPFLAGAVGAKPPLHIPNWMGRLAIGQHGMAMMTTQRGGSNHKAKSLLSWKLKWPTWREGFKNGLEVRTYQTQNAIHRSVA